MTKRKTGVWLIGALGSVATTVVVGSIAFGKGLISSAGMITAVNDFDGLELVDIADLEFGGCDIRKGNIYDSARHLFAENMSIDRRILDEIETDLMQMGNSVCPGTARNCGEEILNLTDFHNEKISLREEISRLRDHLRLFRKNRKLDDVVVVNLASTEPLLDFQYGNIDLDTLEGYLDENNAGSVRASTLYAYAAIQEGCPFINFNPSNAALTPALVQLARQQGVPVMGNDGKTGETLVKSALAPMFTCRNLDVMSWEGFNILGNMDGKVLNHPANRETKIRTKDQTLKKILGYAPHSKVGIDYVPSLGDQKTAWDYIHFRGFLGVPMSLQFVWQGYDSILAAPLVLDLVRLAEFAKREGEAGLMPHLALFFKSPLDVDEHRLSKQFDALIAYVNSAKANNKDR